MSLNTRLPPSLALALQGLVIVACSINDPGNDPPLVAWADSGTSDDLLGYDVIPQLELRIDPADVAHLEAKPREYVKATMVYDGNEYGPVGVKVKGQNSFLPFSQKPSLRINVNEYIPDATFHTLTDLTLNNMSSDPSMMHERLAYRVAREAGLTASRANHFLLTVNGQLYGLYTNVETVKRGMFDDDKGSLYEATDVDFTDALIGGYNLEAGPDDRTLLSGLAQALTIAQPEQAIAAASQYIDIDHFQKFWAMETVVGQYDAFPYSFPGDDYFVYEEPSSGKIKLLPWGMDETFKAADFPPMQVSSILAKTCQAAPACLQGYVDEVWSLLAKTEQFGLEAERARVQSIIAPLVAADPRKPYDAAQVTEGQAQLGYFIRGRRTILTRDFPPPSERLQ